MDGVTILNEIEVVTVVNNTFNFTAAFIALIATVIICGVAGFFIGKLDDAKFRGTLMGMLIGLILSIFTGAIFGICFQYPPETKTTTCYEVTVDDTVSMKEFYDKYQIIEQRGDIFVVEEKTTDGE